MQVTKMQSETLNRERKILRIFSYLQKIMFYCICKKVCLLHYYIAFINTANSSFQSFLVFIYLFAYFPSNREKQRRKGQRDKKGRGEGKEGER